MYVCACVCVCVYIYQNSFTPVYIEYDNRICNMYFSGIIYNVCLECFWAVTHK